MSRKVKSTPGRVTPKKGPTNRRLPSEPNPAGTSATGRYTAPISLELRSSPPWVPVVMVTLLVAGVVVVMTGYFGLQPGGAQILVLLVGGALVVAGFIAAMRYR
jgi:hypothetical protein